MGKMWGEAEMCRFVQPREGNADKIRWCELNAFKKNAMGWHAHRMTRGVKRGKKRKGWRG
jgi:hypothetical protein